MSCTNAKGVAATVELQTIARGAYAAAQERQAVLASSDAEYRERWQALIGEGAPPSVDFDTHVVVFLMGGMHNTGGWTVEPVAAYVEADGTAVVDVKVQGPPPGGMTTQAITYPYAVVTLNQPEVTKVRWVSKVRTD